MKLTEIITLANAPVADAFFALEHSLRAVGCTLPLRVIPYDEQKFELPENSSWLEDEAVFELLSQHKAHRMMRKYACLTRENFLFVDTDVIFLQNPETFFEPFDGFVASCTHWNNPGHTTSPQSLATFRSHSTTWPRWVFNAGQFASSQPVFADFASLKAACLTQPETALVFPYHDQPGLNYLVHHSDVPYTNITLPPFCFESSWAGDYLAHTSIEHTQHSPCFLHWAGFAIDGSHPIDSLFFSHLSPEAAERFKASQKARNPSVLSQLKGFARGIKAAFKENFS